jgi:protein gp37
MSDLFHEDVPNGFIDEVFATMAAGHRHTYQVLTKRPERMRAYMSAADLEERIHWASLNRFGHTPDFDPSVDSWTTGRWPLPNVWLGVSVEDQERADERIPLLLQTPAAVRFVSAEPLLGPVDFGKANGLPVFRWADKPIDSFDGLSGRHLGTHAELAGRWQRHDVNTRRWLDWVIVGGESGPMARPCHEAWVRSIVQQCQAARTPVFVKQLGAFPIWSLSDGRQANGEGGTAQAARLAAGALNPKCADPSEWPEDLRIRQFPGGRA